MRASDKILNEALLEVGLTDLAERAATGEWNDFFGKHTMNMQHLAAELQIAFFSRVRDAYAGEDRPSAEIINEANAINKVTARVMNGDFDATTAESDEWAASPEGQQMKDELGPGMSKVIFGDDEPTDTKGDEEE